MKLWDILHVAQCNQIFHIYVTNSYDQNLPVGKGTREDLCMNMVTGENDRDLFSHLMDDVTTFVVCNDRKIVIFVKDAHFEERLEEQFCGEYAKKWGRLKPETRPWRWSCEIER
ncbi:MAG: hypothetical protein IJV83_05350 [Clostridia bacterium]|nr:hypothetical protein [Schwartzia sp. (in: firmicutes)]MBQ9714728.1 hypothetical protein [Clostridia bacterium]